MDTKKSRTMETYAGLPARFQPSTNQVPDISTGWDYKRSNLVIIPTDLDQEASLVD